MFKAFRSIPLLSSRAFIANGITSSAYVPLQRIAVAGIHTSFPRYNTNEELINTLDSEIKAEKELEQQKLGGSSQPTIPGFSIKTDGADITLTKTYGQEKIYVTLNVNHSVDYPNASEDQEEGVAEEQAGDSLPMSLPSFTVEIMKGGQRLVFELGLVEHEGTYDFEVDEFYIASGEQGQKIEDKVYSASGEFIDPVLHELLFVKFLEERGFNLDFCQNLVHFCTHYEHSQYINLLKKIKDFVSK